MHVLSILSLASLSLAAPAITVRAEPAALLTPREAPNARIIPNEYIIKLKQTAKASAASSTYKTAHTYSSDGFKGFAATLTAAELETIRNDPNVEYVEHDHEIDLFRYLSQKDAPWGLTRISHEAQGAEDYRYDSSAGRGTCVYVIDTGIKADHPDFEGRAEFLHNFTDDGHDGDGAGHGTWTSGLVGSKTYGVAKKSKIFGLKVFDDDGKTKGSRILAAMEYALTDAITRVCPAGHVVNMSLGGGYSQTTNDAADALVRAGLFVAAAAGNENQDASKISPASAPLVCTVGATDGKDARASFSNYGEGIDVWAPGVDLISTSYKGGTTTASGTSGSSPLVAGLGAYLMALERIPGGERVCNRIKDLSVKGIISNLPEGTKNRLAFNGAPE